MRRKNKEDLIMAVLTQTITTETAINWEELAQKIKDNTSALKVGDIITEKTLDGEEMDLVEMCIRDSLWPVRRGLFLAFSEPSQIDPDR